MKSVLNFNLRLSICEEELRRATLSETPALQSEKMLKYHVIEISANCTSYGMASEESYQFNCFPAFNDHINNNSKLHRIKVLLHKSGITIIFRRYLSNRNKGSKDIFYIVSEVGNFRMDFHGICVGICLVNCYTGSVGETGTFPLKIKDEQSDRRVYDLTYISNVISW